MGRFPCDEFAPTGTTGCRPEFIRALWWKKPVRMNSHLRRKPCWQPQETAKTGPAIANGLSRKRIARIARKESRKRDTALEPCKIDPGTGVNAEAERELPVGLPRDLHSIGVGELCRVAIGGADADGDAGIRRQRYAADTYVVRGDAVSQLHRTFEAQEFLDGDFHAFDVVDLCDQLRFLLWPQGQGVKRVADEVGGCLVPGIEQEDALMQELVFGKRLVVILAQDEACQHIGVRLAQIAAALVDQRLEIGQHLGYGSIAFRRPLRRENGLERRENGKRPAAQRLPLFRWNAEQIADDPDRNRRGELLDEIDLRLVRHGIEK